MTEKEPVIEFARDNPGFILPGTSVDPDREKHEQEMLEEHEQDQGGVLAESSLPTHVGTEESTSNPSSTDDYDPADHTVHEVLDHLKDHPEDTDAVVHAEEEGKARTTLLHHVNGENGANE